MLIAIQAENDTLKAQLATIQSDITGAVVTSALTTDTGSVTQA